MPEENNKIDTFFKKKLNDKCIKPSKKIWKNIRKFQKSKLSYSEFKKL